MIESGGGYNKFGGFRSINLLKAVFLMGPFLKISGANSRSHIVHPPFLQGKLSLQPNFQKGGLDRTSSFRMGLLGKRG